MPTIDKQQAIQRLENGVKQADQYDMIEIYKELFPREESSSVENSDREILLNKVVAHFEHGLDEEEIQDLWNVVFPFHRDVWYDEMERVLHYREREDPWAISIDE